MKQLSGLDATFLYLETAEMPMHVGALHLFELPAGFRGRFATALRRHIAQRLPITPVLRRRLWWMPLNLANPAWVDAEPDLRAHIVEVVLRKGSGMPELEAEVSRLHALRLDRTRPLWKFHVFEGLAPAPDGARRVAMYTQLHHAAVDGQAAVALANAILDIEAQPRAVEARAARRPRVYRLEMTEMLGGILASQAQKVAQIVRGLPSTVGTLKDAAGRAVGSSRLFGGGKGFSNVALAPRTPFNVSVSDSRAFAAVTLPLPEVKSLARAHGATVNDIVLLLCGTALRRFLAARRALPRKSLIAAVPVSLREPGNDRAENQATLSLVSLGTHIADTGRRLAHVKAATAAMKSAMGPLKAALPTDFPSLGVPWLMEAAAALYGRARVADRVPQLANLVVSNVPGPGVPLYLAGARMLTSHPASIVVHGVALNITVQSYDQSLDFGLVADGRAVPEVHALGEALRVALDDLRALERPGEPEELDVVVRRAGQRIGAAVSDAVSEAVGGTVGRVTRAVVDTAVRGAVSAARSGGKPAAPSRRR
ncbi:MAG: wax ester/triacylglycerol synthase family O-acyltransferase [Rubrivivax sp.]|jgi:WS/DGAT/MGAT family acyltransferase|nr:wax ester/triacylglycerol synthase family O-acyltransferase [Rubrivivax sp.]